MKKTFKTENGTTIEVTGKEPKKVKVADEIIELPNGTKLVAENVAKGILYEYVNSKRLKKEYFEGERPTDKQKELQELILTEGFPYQEEVGNFWCGVPDVSDDEIFRWNELEKFAKSFDKENDSEMGNIHQYALYLASSVKDEGWEAVVDKVNKVYKRELVIKDHRNESGFSYARSFDIYPTINNMDIFIFSIAWVVLSK